MCKYSGPKKKKLLMIGIPISIHHVSIHFLGKGARHQIFDGIKVKHVRTYLSPW
jgi:hypothetical protein